MTVIAPNANYKDKLARFLQKNNYQEWMTLDSEGQKINISAVNEGDMINRFLIAVDGDKSGEKVFVDVIGKFTAEDISNLINMADKKIQNTRNIIFSYPLNRKAFTPVAEAFSILPVHSPAATFAPLYL